MPRDLSIPFYEVRFGKRKTFHVVQIAINNEVLNTSEGLTTKESAWVNIEAAACGRPYNYRDATIKFPRIKKSS